MWQPQTEYGCKDKLPKSRVFCAATTKSSVGLAQTVRNELIVPVSARRSMNVELQQNCGKILRVKVC